MTIEGTRKYRPEELTKENQDNSSEMKDLADMIADAMMAADERDQDTGSFQIPSDDTGEFKPVTD